MSEPSPSAPGKAGPPKKQVSPARNAIGLIVLIAVVVVGYFEISARVGYTMAVNALNKRLADEDHGLPTVTETEKLIGKAPDDAGSEFREGSSRYMKKTYTWKGLINNYEVAAYYTPGTELALHHIEAGGEKFQPEPAKAPPPAQSGEPQPDAAKKPQRSKGKGSEKGMSKAGADDKKAPEPEDKAKAAADDKKAPEPEDKTKAAADDKKAPEPEDKTKAAADDKKAPEPKPEDTPKAAADGKTKPD
jgi:hypothetical protein